MEKLLYQGAVVLFSAIRVLVETASVNWIVAFHP